MDRKSIPKPVKVKVWDEHIGEENGLGKCNVCGDEIKSSNFDCGHIIAARDGGEDIAKNLVPVCRLCNLSMGTDNLNEFREKYFSDKSYVDLYVKHLLVETYEIVIKKGFMGYKDYEYPYFLSLNEIYNDYHKWIYHNHTKYYERSKSMIYSFDKSELKEKCSEKYGELVRNPETNSEWGFINIRFK
jgi:hypothetical protein